MNITRKWAFARAEYIDPDDGTAWIAESRAGTGTWVIREDETEGLVMYVPRGILRGVSCPFGDDAPATLLAITDAQRASLEMSVATMVELERLLQRREVETA